MDIKKIALFIALILPSLASATTVVPWATPSPSAGYVYPLPVNGVNQGVVVSASSTLATTTLTVLDREGQVYDARVYGAKFDGITDDTIAIQSAINAANNHGGGVVFLPSGYSVVSTLTLYTDVTITGVSATSTVLEASDSSKIAILYSATPISHVSVKKLRLEGTGQNSGGVLNGIKIGDSSAASSFVNIEEVEIDDVPYTGIYLDTAIASSIKQTKVKKSGIDGLYLYNGTSVNLQDVYGTNSNRANFNLDTMTYSTLSGTASEYATYQYYVHSGGNIVFLGTGAEAAHNASSTITEIAQYRVQSAANVVFSGSYSSNFFGLSGTPAYHYYITSSSVLLDGVRGTANLGGGDNDVAPTGTIFIDSGSTVIARYPNFTGQLGAGISGKYSSLIDISGNFGLNLSSITRGKLEVIQSTNSAAGGIAVANSAETGSSRFWVDSNGVQRLSSGPSENGKIALNGGGVGLVGVGTTTPYALFSVSNNLSSVVNTPLLVVASTTGGTSTTTSFVILANGNTGINTSIPAFLFEVYGTSSTTNLFASFSTTTNATTTNLFSTTASSTNLFSQFAAFGTTDTTRGVVSVNQRVNSSTGGLAVFNSAGSQRNWVDANGVTHIDSGAGGTGALIFNIGGGSVGIATTSPWAKFSLGTHNLSTLIPAFVVASSSDAVSSTTQLILINGNLGIGTSTPATSVDIYNSASSTLKIDSDSATKGGCIILKDSDGAGWTQITASNGVLTAKISTNPNLCNN